MPRPIKIQAEPDARIIGSHGVSTNSVETPTVRDLAAGLAIEIIKRRSLAALRTSDMVREQRVKMLIADHRAGLGNDLSGLAVYP